MAAIKAAVSINTEAYSFTSAANHLVSQISTGSGSTGRTVSLVGSGIYCIGKIITDKLAPKDWKKLSRADQKLITDERIKQGLISPRKEGKGNKNKKLQAKVAKLQKKLTNTKATIASLKRKDEGSTSSSDSDTEAEGGATQDDAGNSFGGRSEKAKSKKPRKN